jgi:hypothetical protein
VKAGFHFNADHKSLGTFYGDVIHEVAFKALATLSGPDLSTRMYIGDLRLNSLATEWEETGSSRLGTFNEGKYLEGFADWLAPAMKAWSRLPLASILQCVHRNIYVLYLDNISLQAADCFSQKLEALPYYLGALEVDESSPTHLALYRGSLIPLCQITDTTVSIFCEGFEGEDFDRVLVERLRQAGFTDIRYEVYSEIIFVD